MLLYINNRIFYSKYFFSLFILLATYGCQQYAGEVDTNHHIVRIVDQREMPGSLHPTYEVEIPAYNYLYLNLTTTDPTGNRLPILLEELPIISDDQTVYTFTLREDVYWPDGRPLTVSDVIFSLKIFCTPIFNHPAYHPYIEHIQDVYPLPETKNRFVIQVKPYFLNEKLVDYIPILPEHLLDVEGLIKNYTLDDLKSPDNYQSGMPLAKYLSYFESIGDYQNIQTGEQQYPTGLGPYEITEWIFDERLILTRKENYWANTKDTLYVFSQYPETITFELTDPIQALQTNRADVAVNISPSAYNKLKPVLEDDYDLSLVPGSSYACIILNVRPDPISGNPIFTLPEIRRTIAHLIPVQEIIEARYEDTSLAIPIALPIASTDPGIYPDITPINFNPSKAYNILENLGVIDQNVDGIMEITMAEDTFPLSFSLIYKNTSPTYEIIAQYTQEALADAGIACSLNPLTPTLFNEAIAQRSFDAAIQVYTFQQNAVDFKQLWHTESYTKQGYNISGFGSPDTDLIIDQLRVETDSLFRTQLSYSLQKNIFDSYTTLHLFSPMKGIALHKRLGDPVVYKNSPHVILNNLK